MHTADDFKQLAKHTSNGRLRTRYLALYHFKKGETRTQIAAYLGVARGSVNTWVSNYLAYGLEGLQSKPSQGRPCQCQSVKTPPLFSGAEPDGTGMAMVPATLLIQPSISRLRRNSRTGLPRLGYIHCGC